MGGDVGFDGQHPVTFAPADPPRAGALLVWVDDGDRRVDLAVPPDGTVTALPVRPVPIAEAVGPLLAVPAGAHPTAVFWAGAVREALHLVARGLVWPAVTAGGHDTWRIGPYGPADEERLCALAAAMPAAARAVPGPGGWLPDPLALLRRFCDAVADTLPRADPPADAGGSRLPWAGTTPVRVDARLREWAAQARADATTRLSLRLEPADGGHPDGPWQAVAQVHHRADAGLLTDAAALWRGPVPGFPSRSRATVLLALRHAAGVWPPLGALLDTAAPAPLPLSDLDLTDLAGPAGRRLADAGVEVHWPATVDRGLTAGVRLRSPAGASVFTDPDGWGLDWRLTLRGNVLTEAELEELTRARRPVVRLRDGWVLVDPDLADRARRPDLAPVTGPAALRAALTGTLPVRGVPVEVTVTGGLADLRRTLEQAPLAVPDPPGLAATLRGYQRDGLAWLARLTGLGWGGCLADDMGLGKTVTLIALHLHRQTDPVTAGPTLVVCPASLLGNWEREVTRFAPGTPVRRFHGPARTLTGLAGGVALTTYGTLRRDAARLAGHRWSLLVADEAQQVKNPAAGAARALRTVPAAARVALTGTPVENNLTDLWAILDWSTPGLLGGLGAFRARWVRPVETDRDAAAGRELARLVRPFVLRRRKSDPGVAPELPARTVTDHPVSLTVEQATLYQATVRELLAAIAGRDGFARRGLVVRLLTALKQICNHPAQYLRETAPRLAGRSGKLDLLDDLLDGILPAGGAVLVFTQYVAMARLLHRHLAGRGVDALLLHGGLPVAARDDLVARFQAGRSPVFLLSLTAAGTGLNLTRADHVVHYDRWWNPAVEDQATDRAYRIGQTRPVQVHRLVCVGTVEERVAALLAGKRDLAGAVLDAGPGGWGALDDAGLADLVRLTEEPR
ncbi:DEAD/DEAH box helicase [Micromonospora sagamiensis]|uniref:Helicase-like protein n=1 Tax=Micromonospora sagamiensis TaxID=47875 RepID=A0A562WH22_9ACTN|nr:DEAD/DEAH box helicase [Micromonospora sagamiensis]TWJ29187.1 helicase-like protein [Micromonospora sagamiensis]